MEPVVHLRAAVALLGRFPALAGADLDVERGEIVLLQGPNGAGKTTLLRVCAGLVPVVEGDATVLGCDLRRPEGRRAVRRRVGLLGHGSGLYDDLTVADNVLFWARAAGADRADAHAAMAALGLRDRLAGIAVSRLSAGQRRRAAIACMVARRSELWLLDEPHAGLDQAGRDVLDVLVRRAAAAGATVVLVSHELDRATALADRALTVAGGTTRPPRSGLNPGPPERGEGAPPTNRPSATRPGWSGPAKSSARSPGHAPSARLSAVGPGAEAEAEPPAAPTREVAAVVP